jgi:hypothetical protein
MHGHAELAALARQGVNKPWQQGTLDSGQTYWWRLGVDGWYETTYDEPTQVAR